MEGHDRDSHQAELLAATARFGLNVVVATSADADALLGAVGASAIGRLAGGSAHRV